MKARACFGSCHQGREACTMPGTCCRPVVIRLRAARWWHDPERREIAGLVVLWLLWLATEALQACLQVP